MRSEGFPFTVWGSGGWTRVRVVCAVGSRARRGLVVVSSLIPCRGDWRRACRLCGAVSLGLLNRASSGSDSRGAGTGSSCASTDSSGASTSSSRVSTGSSGASTGGGAGTGPGSGWPKRLIFKGQASTESPFLGLRVRALGRSKTAHF